VNAADAIAALRAEADPARAAEAAAYHKTTREVLGLPVPRVTELANSWRAQTTVDERIGLARDLWAADIHETRIAAAKLFVQARIRPDEGVWQLLTSWLPDFDGWAIADHVAQAGQRRLLADPSRLDLVEGWTKAPAMWTRRAALVFTLPWTKQNFARPADLAIRDRVLGWCGSYVPDRDWFIQKAIAWWIRDLSKHDPARARAFLDTHGEGLKPFARKEAGKYL